VCPITRLCAETPFALFLLSISRFTAGTFYTSAAITFTAKLSLIRIQIQNSFFSDFAHFEPHDIHQTFGWIAAASAILHSIAHVIRYAIYHPRKLGNMTSISGILGMVAIVATCAIAYPAEKLRYEIRKGLHYAFVLVFICLFLHSFNVMVFSAVFLAAYVIDLAYLIITCTQMVDEPMFVPIGGGTSVSFRVPDGYKFKPGQYVYVNAPWISKHEWHAFSLIPATEFVEGSVVYSDAASFFAEAVGDWTKKLFDESIQSVRRPIWISPAFPSMADKTIKYDKIVLICTGIGITPAIYI
ncbi:unnamed protein product, partial [Phaeothamnion confervicola]